MNTPDRNTYGQQVGIIGESRQRFVERSVRVGEALDAQVAAEGLANRPAQRDADVFDEMVRVDVEVPLRLDFETDAALLVWDLLDAPTPGTFFDEQVKAFLNEQGLSSPDEMVPDQFVRWVFPKLLAHRRPLYDGIAERHGYAVDAKESE